jgi:hypothetical protein
MESKVFTVLSQENTPLVLRRPGTYRIPKVQIEINCPECEGEGSYEYGPECTRPASMCCGGCYKTARCEECNGTGRIEYTLDASQVGDLVHYTAQGMVQEAQELLKECKE